MAAFIIRLFLLAVIVLLVYPALRRLLAGFRQLPAAPRYEPMTRCAVCGLHLPLASALERNGRHYCSQEHAGQQ